MPKHKPGHYYRPIGTNNLFWLEAVTVDSMGNLVYIGSWILHCISTKYDKSQFAVQQNVSVYKVEDVDSNEIVDEEDFKGWELYK